jgi:hypothetical protein
VRVSVYFKKELSCRAPPILFSGIPRSPLAETKSRLTWCLSKDLAFAGPQGGRGNIQEAQNIFVQRWSILSPMK